jgi:Flp pilus assembly protein TadD
MLPDSIPVRAACAWNLTHAGRAAEAVDLVRAGLARQEDPRLENSLARALIADGHVGDALEAAERAVSRDPSEVNLTILSLAQIASGNALEGRRTRARVHDPDLLQEIDEALPSPPPAPSRR